MSAVRSVVVYLAARKLSDDHHAIPLPSGDVAYVRVEELPGVTYEDAFASHVRLRPGETFCNTHELRLIGAPRPRPTLVK